jgi:hypothetical protein
MPRRPDDDDEDRDEKERPRKRSRDDEEEDEDQPHKRGRGDDDEDDDRPQRRRKGELDSGTLRSVATYQKGILVCILIYLLLVVGGFFVPNELKWIVGLVALPVLIGATVFVFLLSMKIYSPVVGVLLALLTFIPCVGLIVLLIINSQATSILRRHGISVGLLGANMSDIP